MSISAIAQNLSANFILSGQFADQVSLSLLSGISPLWYGPGGLGKTEMILTVMNTLSGSQSGMIECHPDMAVSDLFGGAIALTQKKKLSESQPFYEEEVTKESIDFGKGLLGNDIFFLEEMLDCPMPVLAALKAVMTNKQWAGVKSKHKLLLGATNINPYNLVEELPPTYSNSYKALLQRFIVIEHNPEYNKQGYQALLDFQPNISNRHQSYTSEEWLCDKELVEEVFIPQSIQTTLCFVAEKSGEDGSPVSPRTFMWTTRLLKAAAYLRDSHQVEEEDLRVLSLVGSFASQTLESLDKLIEESNREKKASDDLLELENNLAKIERFISAPSKSLHFTFLTGKANAEKLKNLLAKIKVTNNLESRKKALMQQIEKLIQTCHAKAEENVFVQELF
jgi:MoxR-like ATPase